MESFTVTAGTAGVFVIGTGKGTPGDVDEAAIDVVLAIDPGGLLPVYIGPTLAAAKALTGFAIRPNHPPLRFALEPGESVYAAATTNTVVSVLQTRRRS